VLPCATCYIHQSPAQQLNTHYRLLTPEPRLTAAQLLALLAGVLTLLGRGLAGG